MRLPYIPDPPPFQDAESQQIVSAMRARRLNAGHPGLVELDRTLLHSVPVAAGWNAFLGAIRTQTASLTAATRELVICRVAALNGARYEWDAHAPLLRAGLVAEPGAFAAGVDAAAAADAVVRAVAVAAPEPAQLLGVEGLAAPFASRALAVLRFVDESTRLVKVAQPTWDELRSVCEDGPVGDRQVVEITATCAAYNCVSRFLVALDVGEANEG